MRQSIPSIMRASLGALAIATALSAPFAPATAGGFYVQEQSSRGVGRAFSGEAASIGADALWWNPAAIARSERELYLGVTGRRFDTDIDDDGSTITRPIPPNGLTTPVGGRARLSDVSEDDYIPTGAFSMPVSDRVALGVSVNRPYIIQGEHGEDSWARYDTIRNHIETTNIQGTAAVRLTEWLDLGFGIDAQYTDAALIAAYPNLSPLLPDGRSELTGDGWNYGFTIGGQAHLSRLSLGVSYRSEMDHELKGRIAVSGLQDPLSGGNFQAAAETVFTTPWLAIVGVRWRVMPDLTVNAQVQRFGWSEYDHIHVSMGRETATIEQNFKDVTTTAVGLDYQATPRLTLSGGVQHDPTPTPDSLRESGVADADRWIYGVGASMRLRPRITIDASLGYSDYDDSRLSEDAVFYDHTPARTTARLRGKFGGDVKTASVGLRLKF